MKKPNFFTRLFGKLKNWYEKSFEKFEDQGHVGIDITNWLKLQFDNGNLEAIANLTPMEWDDELVAKGKRNLVPALEAYADVHGLVVAGKTRLEIVQVVHNYLKSLKTRRSFWVEISGDLIVILADGKVTWNEAIILGQKLFWQIFNKDRKLPLAA